MAADLRYRIDPSGDRGRPLTIPAIPSLALLTALAAPATPVASPSARGGGRGDLAADPPQEHPSPFSVEWQFPLPTRDLIDQPDNRDVVVDVRDMTRGAGELFVAASHSLWERGGHLTQSGGLSDATKEGVGGAGAA